MLAYDFRSHSYAKAVNPTSMRAVAPFLVLSAALVGLLLAWYFGVLAYLWAHDRVYLTTTIAVLGLGSMVAGLRWPAWLGMAAEMSVALGLIGNVIAFMLEAAALQATGTSSIGAAFLGFQCTAVGVTAAMLLRLQAWLQGVRS